MVGWIIAAAAVILAHKSQAASTATPATHVLVGPTPAFGNVNPAHYLGAPPREPFYNSIDQWQNGPMLPVPAGSRQDVLPRNPGSVSDNVNNQLVQVAQFVSGAPDVRNPTGTGGASGGASSGGSGATAPAGGTGGGTSLGGGGGFSKGGGRILL